MNKKWLNVVINTVKPVNINVFERMCKFLLISK